MFNSFAIFGIVAYGVAIILALCIIIFIFEVWMFVSVVVNKSISSTRKLLWIIGMIIIHPFIAIGYYFTDHKKI